MTDTSTLLLAETAAEAAPARPRVHYAWIVVGTAFLTMLISAGAVGAPGLLIRPLEQEFGWTAAEISGALAIRLTLFGLVAPFAAALINRFGLRRVTAASLIIVSAALALATRINSLWQLYLLWGGVIGAGTGLTALMLATTVATRWFEARRGLVVGLLTASSATGQMLFLPMLACIIEDWGWRAAVLLVSVALTSVAGVVLWLMRDDPAEMGLRPFGAPTTMPVLPVPRATGGLALAALSGLTIGARSRVFWLLFGSFFICGASTNGLIQTHFVPFCGDHGLTATVAAGVLATMGVCDFFGTIVSGWLADRYDGRWLLFAYYGLRGLSLLLLPYAAFSAWGLAPFAVFYGLDWVATVPPTVRVTAATFGRERANLVFGWIFAGHQLGAGAAALAAGITRTSLGSYTPAFTAAGVLCAFAAIAVLTLPSQCEPLRRRTA